MIVSSLFYIATFSVEAADVTITDGIGDVSSIDYLTGETKVVPSHPDINVDNLDLTKATYTQQGTQATVSIQVKGTIENRGKIIDPYSEDFLSAFTTVEYEVQLETSEQTYSLSYSNQTGTLSYGDEQINLTSSNFSVVGNTLTISFTLTSAGETYSNLSVSSTYLKANFSEAEPSIEFLSDVAPNPSLMIYDAYASNIGNIGESIQFNGSVEPLTGQPPPTHTIGISEIKVHQRSSIQHTPIQKQGTTRIHLLSPILQVRQQVNLVISRSLEKEEPKILYLPK
jgi:hypothetical protein